MNKDTKGYTIISRYQNKKCFYGLGIYNDEKIFFKEFNLISDLEKEIDGYNIVKKYYRVPKLITKYDNTIIYEYKDELINSTLYEYLYYDVSNINLNNILNQYKNSLKDIKRINEDELCNDKFYKKRINMIDNYSTLIDNLDIKEHIKKVIFEISQDKTLHAFISQGDPTDTNISTDGCFTDFENGGYNSLVGEIAIFLISILTHGGYFYPKYNSKVYMIRSNYKVNLKISSKNINIIVSYLDMIKSIVNKDIINEINKYLKYYICFRLLTPIDVSKMDEIDQEIIFSLFELFYEVNSIDELISLITNWDVCYINNFINKK